MTNFVRYMSGQPVLNESFQMSNSLTHQNIIETPLYEWQNEYWEKVFKHRGFDIPMPLMVKNQPFWGGVYPPEKIKIKEGKRYIASFKLQIFSVNESDVRPPNDAEYKKHFKKYVDSGAFKLTKIKNSYCGVMINRR